ncbi:MAG: 4Fe-4S binding protein [Spirochaetota bacterium]
MTKYLRESALAAATSFFFLAFARAMSSTHIILADRFHPGAGWLQIAALSVYAAFVASRLMDPSLQPRWRKRIWLLFSIVFFSQLLLGLAGFQVFLMSGKLHLPIPAVILAGPLYRGGSYFMPILFTASVLVLGPAWCSYLCYFGAWDGLAAEARKRPGTRTKHKNLIQTIIVLTIIAAAVLMRVLGAPVPVALWPAVAFGIAGIIIMLIFSTRSGVMTHCVTWCPMGLVANVMGKVSPFRIRLSAHCTDCMACTTACRYDALGGAEVTARRPGLSCTLCGDCLSKCRHDSIGYRFPGLSPAASRRLFIVTASIMHTLFIGIAML